MCFEKIIANSKQYYCLDIYKYNHEKEKFIKFKMLEKCMYLVCVSMKSTSGLGGSININGFIEWFLN
jgi:hypothetical protein